jgi:4a-hydroxytetrahydrobiopterin dehydratase
MNKLSSLSQVKLYRAKALLPTSHEILAKHLKLFTPDHEYNRLSFTYWFKKDDYTNILEKMNRIGWLADEMDHHPEWKLSDRNLQINLSTHDIGNKISLKDYILADYIENVIAGKNSEQILFEKWNKRKVNVEELIQDTIL